MQRQFRKNNRNKPWVIDPDNLKTLNEEKLWFAYVEQYAVNDESDENAVQVLAAKDTPYKVSLFERTGSPASSAFVIFNKEVELLLATVNAEELHDQHWLKFIEQRYAAHQQTVLKAGKVYVLNSNTPKLIRVATDVVFIDPMVLNPETAPVLKQILREQKAYEFHAGQIFSVGDKKYVLLRDMGWYARKEGKTGNRYGVFGEFRGKGTTGVVKKLEGVIQDDEEKELNFKLRQLSAAESPAAKKRKAMVVKREVHPDGNTELVKNEHECLTQAEKKVKPLTLFTNDKGEVVSLLFMEEAKDLSLHDYLYDKSEQKRELDFGEAIALCEAGALAYITNVSEPGIVHSDLKPENMFVKLPGKKPQPKITVIDYGFAQLKAKLQMLFMGTPDYVSPEVFAGRPYDEKRDIFSMGILFAEILGNKDSAALSEALQAHQKKHAIADNNVNSCRYFINAAVSGDLKMYCITLFANLRHVDTRFEAQIERFILGMLSFDPEDRPDGQEVYDFFKAIRQQLNLPQSVADPAAVISVVPRQPSESRKGKSKELNSGSSEDLALTHASTSPDQVAGGKQPPAEHTLAVTQKEKEHAFARNLFERIECLNGKVKRWLDIVGGETVFVKFQNDKSDIYSLPAHAASMIDSLSEFSNHDITFIELIENCIECARQGYLRGSTTFFRDQDPEVTKFYQDVFYNLREQASYEVGIKIPTNFKPLGK